MSSEITLLLTRGFLCSVYKYQFRRGICVEAGAGGVRAGQAPAPNSSTPHHSPDPLAASPRHPTRVFDRH